MKNPTSICMHCGGDIRDPGAVFFLAESGPVRMNLTVDENTVTKITEEAGFSFCSFRCLEKYIYSYIGAQKYTCQNCKHTWTSRKAERPRVCPPGSGCGSPHWE